MELPCPTCGALVLATSIPVCKCGRRWATPLAYYGAGYTEHKLAADLAGEERESAVQLALMQKAQAYLEAAGAEYNRQYVMREQANGRKIPAGV
jgi:hypothetical protein